MFNSMKDDISRNGLVSNILKRLADFEIFMRNHQTVNHGIKDFVDVTAFTPVVEGTTTAGTGTYTTQLGEYSRIGNIVFFEIQLSWTAHTGTGDIQISGLPIASSNNGIASAVTVFWSDLTLTAVGNKVVARIFPSTTVITPGEIGSGSVAAIPMDTSVTVLRFSGFYFVD